MAVTVDKKPDLVLVELFAFQRYVWAGRLFVANVAYQCTREEADTLLANRVEGVAPFRVFIPKPPPQTVTQGDNTPLAELPTKETTSTPTAPPKGITISSPEEEKELFGDVDKDVTKV